MRPSAQSGGLNTVTYHVAGKKASGNEIVSSRAHSRAVGGVGKPDLVVAGANEDEGDCFIQGHILLHYPASGRNPFEFSASQ